MLIHSALSISEFLDTFFTMFIKLILYVEGLVHLFVSPHI
jgi:hypothetical protein